MELTVVTTDLSAGRKHRDDEGGALITSVTSRVTDRFWSDPAQAPAALNGFRSLVRLQSV
jgi:hypothetical protein